MTITLQPMLAEPSTIGLGLLFLAILAGAAIAVIILIALIRLPKKLSPENPATSNQASPDLNRHSRTKSFWIWLPLAFLLLVGAIFGAHSLSSKPDVLSPTEFLKMVDSHRIIQAKLYCDTHSPVYTITGTYQKLDEQEHLVPTHFKTKMLLTDIMLERLVAGPNFKMVEPNNALASLLTTVLPILLMSLILLGIGFVVFILIRATSKKNELPQTPPSAPAATQPIPRKCPQCGAQLRPDVPEGLCPACLLQRGIATEGGAPPQSQSFTPPPIAELARLFPQLEILEVIGQGGMGAVYKARQPSLERFVALKILTPRSGGDLDFAGRFTREARALARLSHPNIVAVYDFGQISESSLGADPSTSDPLSRRSPGEGGTPLNYFIMEYVDGPNLRQVEQAGKLTPREALQIIPQICAALQFAHDEGIVHRDIKPENVLIDKKGRVKIADFGLAKILGHQSDLRLTGARDVMGTPHYMAPEQVEKPQEVDHRADIYSLGVVFYEMLTGELPLGKFDPPSHRVQVDVRLDEVVLRSLAKSPERRYQQVSEIKTDIENIAERPAQPVTSPVGNRFDWSGGVDYRSKQTLFGLPLVHITAGTDPLTGKVRVAKGIIAIGGQARGVIAVGGLAMGFVAIGGAAVGAIALGGGAFGILSFGGLAIALLLALGGGAIAPIAIGGAAMGYMAFGGGGLGAHVLAGNTQDPVARQFFGDWVHALVRHVQLFNAIVVIVGIGLCVGLPLWIRRRIQSQDVSGILDRVHSWLAMMDAGNYGGSWEMAAPYFQRVVSRNEWIAKSEKVRHPLGAVLSRRFRNGTFSGNGTRYEARFDTDFDGMHAAVETVTFALQSNGDWRAIGYLIKPMRAGFRPWMWIPIGAGVILVLILALNASKRPVTSAPASANFHYLVFECDASNVDRLIPSSARQRIAETNAFVAVVDTNTLRGLLTVVVPQRYILKDDERLVTSQDWKPGLATTWAYNFDEPPPAMGVCEGTAEGFLGVRNRKGRLEAHVDVSLRHSFSPRTFAPDAGVESRLFYEGPVPDGALVFLVPYLGPNNSSRYLIASFRITDATSQYASQPVPKAIIHIRQFNVITSADAFSSDYAATVPPGYEIKATADFGRATVFPRPGTQEYRIQWMWERRWHPPKMLAPGQSIPANYHAPLPIKFDSSEQRQAQAATVSAQLQELQDQGPIPVLFGEPKQVFCVTNGSGEFFRGFLELVPAQNQTSAPQSDALAKLIAQRQSELAQTSASGPEILAKLITERQKELLSREEQQSESQTTSSSMPLAEKALFAEQPPVVVETYPASGASDVAPGITELRVRFSQPMEDESWSWATAWEDSAPESVGEPHYLDDGRTCVMKVRLEPGKTYAWWLNSDKFKNFKDRQGRPAVPYLLTFQTQSK